MEKSNLSNFEVADDFQANDDLTRGFSGACPRCMNGTMYKEINEEFVCLQCGHRSYPKTNVQTFREGSHKNIGL